MPKKAVKKPRNKKKDLKPDEKYKLEKASVQKQEEEQKAKKEPYLRLDLSPDMQDKIAVLVLDEVDKAGSNEERKTFIRHLDYCRKRYTMEDLNTDFPWEFASKRRTGGTTTANDRLMPRLKKPLFYSGHVVDVIPGEGNTEENAERQEEWLDSVLREDMKVEEIIGGNVLYDAIMANMGFVKNSWVVDEDIKMEVTIYESAEELLRNYPDAIVRYPQYVLRLTGYQTIQGLVMDFPGILQEDFAGLPSALDAKGNPVRIALREKFRDGYTGGRLEWVDPADVFFPKGTIDETKAWHITQRLRGIRRDELIRKGKDGFFDNVDKMFADKDDDDSVKDFGKEYEIYESDLRYDIDGDKLEERGIYWIGKGDGGEKVFLRGIHFPFTHGQSPLIMFRTDGHRYGFYKGGLGAKLQSVNCSEDRRVNQIANRWDQAVVKAWRHIVTPGSPYNPRTHKYFPGANIPMANAEELTEITTSDIPASSMTLLEDNRRENELLVGFPLTAASGQVNPKDPQAPAKKHELELAEGNIAIGEYMKKFVPGMKNLASQTQMNYYQFTDDTAEVRYRKDKGYEGISKQDMRLKAMFTLHTALESVSAADKARVALAWVDILAQHPLTQQNYELQWYMLETAFKNYSEDFARNVDKLFSEDIKNLIIQQQEQAAALAQQKEQEEAQIKQIKDHAQRLKMSGVEKEEVDQIVAQAMAEMREQGGQV